MVEWRKQIVRNDGVALAVFEVERSVTPSTADPLPTVLLVHGWPDSHHLWTQVAPLLADRFRVVAYDCRGFGDSDRPAGDDRYALHHLADDLFAVADAISPDEPVHVLAHDWGSVQTWEAVTRPGAHHRIASFVSVSGPNLDYLSVWARENLSHPTPGNLGRALAQGGSSAYTVFFQLPLLPKLFFSTVGSAGVWREFLYRVEGTPKANAVFGPTLRADMISGLRLYRANIRRKLAHPDPRPTSVPVLEVVNERDVALRPAIFDITHRYAERLWRRRTATGHWLPLTRPDYLAEIAGAFIADQSGTGTPSSAGSVERTRVFGSPTKFSGKLAVITGAGSGIGRETAYALAEQGCHLVLADLDLDSVQETARESKRLGADAAAYRLDVSDTAAFVAFAAEVRDEHGIADIVVNNAGIALAGGALDATDAQVDRLLAVDLRGVITGSREFGRQMKERGVGGHIVNVASAAAFTPSRDLGLYSAAKAGVLMFSESLRGELAEHRIGVTAICPGIVDTNIVSQTPIAGFDPDDEQSRRDRLDKFYQRRGFTPDRVARDIVTAIDRNKAVVPVTPEAKIGYRIYRFAPWLSRLGARQTVAR
ncbi:SDR family oxidoreductase [Gordonia sp. ABSL1-1]|uniref:SDR family oxidoreductase n=1 Tax=Gordonia sp. ABSL1-1 TaxID=3053923 RepID=UPI0025746222|nr:SDR family oxidoreductase [Gordonia sp. ABSL1-1]MDL9938744.1 SDR family oxidoreductase [Gordonia sp. ABSL1-1]